MPRFALFMLVLLVAVMPLRAQDTPIYALPSAQTPAFSAGSMAQGRDGTLYTVNPFANSLAVVNPTARTLLAEVPLAAFPHAVALTPDSRLAVVIYAQEPALSVIDTAARQELARHPLAKAASALAVDDNASAWVVVGERVQQVRLSDGQPLTEGAFVAAEQLWLWGDFVFGVGQDSLYLTHRARLGELRDRAFAPLAGCGGSLLLVPRERSGYWLQNACANTQSADVLHTLELRTLRPATSTLLDLMTAREAMPRLLAFETARNRLYVGYASGRVAVVDGRTRLALASFASDSLPQSAVLATNGSALYVHQPVVNSIAVYDMRFYGLQGDIPTTTQSLSTAVTVGARLFYAADARGFSCAACHTLAQPQASRATHPDYVGHFSALPTRGIETAALRAFYDLLIGKHGD